MNATSAQIAYITKLQSERAYRRQHNPEHADWTDLYLAPARELASGSERFAALSGDTSDEAREARRALAAEYALRLHAALVADLDTDPSTLAQAEASELIDRLTGKTRRTV